MRIRGGGINRVDSLSRILLLAYVNQQKTVFSLITKFVNLNIRLEWCWEIVKGSVCENERGYTLNAIANAPYKLSGKFKKIT